MRTGAAVPLNPILIEAEPVLERPSPILPAARRVALSPSAPAWRMAAFIVRLRHIGERSWGSQGEVAAAERGPAATGRANSPAWPAGHLSENPAL